MGKIFRQNHSTSLHFRVKCIFVFYTEIQDGCHKWRENDFGENLPVDSADTLRIKNFVKIAVAHTVSEINAFLCFQH